jgi:hypothetical protein
MAGDQGSGGFSLEGCEPRLGVEIVMASVFLRFPTVRGDSEMTGAALDGKLICARPYVGLLALFLYL